VWKFVLLYMKDYRVMNYTEFYL